MEPNITRIYTIGHSNHPWERFVELLIPHGIELLVDVRSNPYSRFAPWSNRRRLDAALAEQGIEYLWKGDELGGMPRGRHGRGASNPKITDDWYRTRSRDPKFRSAIDEVSRLAVGKRLVLMCSEGDPTRCHRTMLIAPAFSKGEFEILHILPKPIGTLVSLPLD